MKKVKKSMILFCVAAMLTLAAPMQVFAAAPIITTDLPEIWDANSGDTVTFTLGAEGENLTYQWQVKPYGSLTYQDMANENSASLTLVNVRWASHDGSVYRCVVSNEEGSAVSSAVFFAVEIVDVSEEAIVTQPQSQSVTEGATAEFTIEVIADPVTYMWLVLVPEDDFEGEEYDVWRTVGTDSPTLTIANVTAAMNGYRYLCSMTSGGDGSVESAAATLTVTEPEISPPPAVPETALTPPDVPNTQDGGEMGWWMLFALSAAGVLCCARSWERSKKKR